MKAKVLTELFKFYKGEKENPFAKDKSQEAMWWDGEKSLYDKVVNDNNYWERLSDTLKQAIKEKGVSNALVDTSIPFDKRVIIFYLDLWHGKWFPNESLDVIFDYVKA